MVAQLKRTLLLLTAGAIVTACAASSADRRPLPSANASPLSIFGEPIFNGSTGEQVDWDTLFASLDEADIVVFGESHADARGHAIQRELIVQAARRWGDFTLSLEEFDRSQQSYLDAYSRYELTREELKDVRAFVDPVVRDNWFAWYYPKIESARDGGARLLASNAPLRYSRLVRNVGCDNLPALSVEQRATFECPGGPADADYRERFDTRMQRVARQNKQTGLKPLEDKQLDRMFAAHQVWDATMADSIVRARVDDRRVLHLVGGFHADYRGGLIKEINARDSRARVVVVSFIPRRSNTLRSKDRQRADWVIYTRG